MQHGSRAYLRGAFIVMMCRVSHQLTRLKMVLCPPKTRLSASLASFTHRLLRRLFPRALSASTDSVRLSFLCGVATPHACV